MLGQQCGLRYSRYLIWKSFKKCRLALAHLYVKYKATTENQLAYHNNCKLRNGLPDLSKGNTMRQHLKLFLSITFYIIY